MRKDNGRITNSKNGVPIRLIEERWSHIIDHHNDIAGYFDDVLNAVEDPDMILKGWTGELLAVKKINDRYIIAAYKEISKSDGFIITAFFISKIEKVKRRGVIWEKQ
jgi:hypothetical protein